MAAVRNGQQSRCWPGCRKPSMTSGCISSLREGPYLSQVPPHGALSSDRRDASAACWRFAAISRARGRTSWFFSEPFHRLRGREKRGDADTLRREPADAASGFLQDADYHWRRPTHRAKCSKRWRGRRIRASISSPPRRAVWPTIWWRTSACDASRSPSCTTRSMSLLSKPAPPSRSIGRFRSTTTCRRL